MKKLTFQMLTLLTVCSWLVNAQDQSLSNKPPKAPVREVTDTYFDQQIVDPYRWMEDLRSPETVEWMRSQNDYARRFLSHYDDVPVILRIIQYYDEETREEVKALLLSSLGKSKQKIAYEKLTNVAQNERSLELRRRASELLKRRGTNLETKKDN